MSNTGPASYAGVSRYHLSLEDEILRIADGAETKTIDLGEVRRATLRNDIPWRARAGLAMLLVTIAILVSETLGSMVSQGTMGARLAVSMVGLLVGGVIVWGYVLARPPVLVLEGQQLVRIPFTRGQADRRRDFLKAIEQAVAGPDGGPQPVGSLDPGPFGRHA